MGEPRRLTPDVQQRIIQHVADGNYPHIAAQLAGIPARTFQRWLHDGREDLDSGVEHSSVARLALAIEKARAECVARKVTRVQEAGVKSWQANAWWLERNFPDMYGQRRDVTVRDQTSQMDVLAGIGTLTLQEITRRFLASQSAPQGAAAETPLALPETADSSPSPNDG